MLSKILKASMGGLLIAGILAGCSSGSDDKDKQPVQKEEKKQETPNKEEQKKAQETSNKKQNAVDKSADVKSDEALTKEIEKEKGVSQANLIVTKDSGGYVMVDVIADADLKKDEAKKLSETYAKKVKDKYKDETVDVQVHQNDKILAQTTLKKKEK